MSKFPSVKERFWSKVDIRSKRECWIWKATRDSKGRYGLFKYKGRFHGAHRVAYILTYGSIPEGNDILHSCDNPPCCNPNHFYTGTALDNVDDMMEKERDGWTCGMDRPGAKLTDDDVREIRRLYKSKSMTQREMAKKFKVSDTTIWDIVHRNRWVHITGD